MKAIFDIDNWKEIGATLARNKTRTFLTAFGIFWGTAMLAMLLGGAQGLKSLMQANFAGFASNSAVIFPQRTTMPYKGYAKGMSWSMTQNDVDNLRRSVAELEAVSPIISGNATVKSGTRKFQGNTWGIEPNFMEVLNPIVTQGRFINESDIANDSKVCLLGDNAASALFGAGSPLGQFVECDNVYYKVVGTVRQRSEVVINGRLEDGLILPLSTMRRTYNMGNQIHFMILIAKNGVSPTELRPKIYRAIRLSHPLHPDDKNNMEFMDISSMFDQVNSLFMGIDILILFVGLSSLIAGIIGVGNIMWIVVKERTKEFGIRRALGARPRSILSQIMSESMILTAIAGTLGICFAVGVLALADKIVGATVKFDPSYIRFQLSFTGAIAIMALFLVLGAAAGAIPARKAMRIKPIEALNDK